MPEKPPELNVVASDFDDTDTHRPNLVRRFQIPPTEPIECMKIDHFAGFTSPFKRHNLTFSRSGNYIPDVILLQGRAPGPLPYGMLATKKSNTRANMNRISFRSERKLNPPLVYGGFALVPARGTMIEGCAANK